jgi:putative ABC transport system permease protein
MLITAINDSYIGLSVYADINYLSRMIGEDLALTGVQLQTDPHPKVFEAFCKEVKRLPALQAFNSRQANISSLMNTLIKTQDIIIAMITMFAGVIFFASLVNTSLIGLAERRREIATLRVLGYSPVTIGGYFLRESMSLSLVGTLAGFPLGYLLVWYLTKIYDTEMFRFPLLMPPVVWIKTFIAAIIFSVMAHLLVQREIFKMDWRDALNVKE